MAAWLDFSPLFIGEPRAAFLGPRAHLVSIGFSPLFIGEPRAASPRWTGERSSVRFQSPLHRGAARGKALPASPNTSPIMFQSPLHRGAARGVSLSGYRATWFLVSVPSSSG